MNNDADDHIIMFVATKQTGDQASFLFFFSFFSFFLFKFDAWMRIIHCNFNFFIGPYPSIAHWPCYYAMTIRK